MTVALWWTSLTVARAGLLDMLSPLERDRVAALTRPADQGRSMVGAALLRTVAADYLRCQPRDVVIERSCADCGLPHGAPRIVGPGEQPFPWVSLSHSGVLVVVAASLAGPVGVDVQRVADLSDPAEAGTWVKREALLKAETGRALAEVGQPALTNDGPWVQEVAAPLAGYLAAVAAFGAIDEVVSRHWE